MKKLLLFLFLPLLTFGQDILLDHSYIDPAGFEVGQTITVKFNIKQFDSTAEVEIVLKRLR